MKEVYKVMWLFAIIGMFALADLRLPYHGFGWLQQSDWWQGGKAIVMYFLLPYLLLRLFEIAIVGKNHAQIGNLADDLPTIDNPHQVPATQQQGLPMAQQPALPGDLPVMGLSGIKPVQGLPIPATNLDRDLAQAVILYQQEGSYAKAAVRLGGKITAEGMRQRVIAAYRDDPEWVAEILPHDKLPKG